MTRLWLAAVLGVVLGLGVASASYSPTASTPNPNIGQQALKATLTQSKPTELPTETQQAYPLTLISLLIGIALATPIFLLARRRS